MDSASPEVADGSRSTVKGPREANGPLRSLLETTTIRASVEEPARWVERIRNAGGIFLGEHSFEVLGDYVAGPSHIMPTGGTARFNSPVNVLDFVKVINIIGLDPDTTAQIGPAAARFARAESLTAHAAAAERRGGGQT